MTSEYGNIRVRGIPSLEDKAFLNHTLRHGTSFIAAKWAEQCGDGDCKQEVIGTEGDIPMWYIGAVNPETGRSCARDSEEYYPSREEAQRALDTKSWTQRLRP